jgi:hypothetical protein
MTFDEFKASLNQTTPPADLNPLLLALWQDAQGNWDMAHRLTQAVDDADGAWVHAYLHRKEGDLANAGYWYSRARQPFFQHSLKQEWEVIASALLLKA